jgi:hypothetical protein
MRRLVIIALVILSVAIVAWLVTSANRRKPPEASTVESARTLLTTPGAVASATASRGPGNTQIDLGSLSRDQVEAEVKRRDAEDSKWEWKTTIRFYGQAVDDKLKAVPNANVHFQWTDLSSKGTTEADATTDEHGQFYLDNVQGKRLLVRVTKPGYYSSDVRNRLSFEFANPFEEIYYQPQASTPVLFYLRKQGPGAELIRKSTEVVLPGDGTAAMIRLETGFIASDGQLEVKAWKPWPPRPMSPPYDWRLTLTIPDGGFIEFNEEFAFEAPEAGYIPSFEVNMPASASDRWKVSAEKTLYFSYGDPKKYGRLKFRTDGNSRYVFIDYVLNPSGSRNLEEAAARTSTTH